MLAEIFCPNGGAKPVYNAWLMEPVFTGAALKYAANVFVPL